MDKPEFLTGEVKSFEEIFNDYLYPDISMGDCYEAVEQLFEINKFYLQPFTPSLIVELFEDIEPDAYMEFITHTNQVWINHYRFPIPKTLNDFINDCERSGITLQWKTHNGVENS